MGLNPRCPKCGSDHVQLTSQHYGHGCFMTVVFGVFYLAWRLFKYIIGMILFAIYDWWAAILHALCGKGHKWICRSWFSNRRRTYYCHDCGHNFSE